MTYSEKLKDPRWQKKRLEILNRDNFCCTKCGDDRIELHVHHTDYKSVPWESDENTLFTLCKNCHYIVEDCKPCVNSYEDILSIDRHLYFYAAYVKTENNVVCFLYTYVNNQISLVIGITERTMSTLFKKFNHLK